MSDPNAYTVGWICALPTEYVAARQFLDEEHGEPEFIAPNDFNSYTLGTIGKHYVVIAVLPAGENGIVSAASVAKDMLHSFPNVRVGLMVGIGGGAPSPKHDIRLGDIVVSTPRNGMGGVFQYDFGKTVQGQKFVTTGYLNQPPTAVRTAVADLRARYEADGHQIPETINKILTSKRKLKKNYGRPDQDSDRLYKVNVVHPQDAEDACANVCSSDSADLILRQERDEDDDNPAIHYGLIASANQLMKNAELRDQLAKDKDVLCFEMEAAGLMNNFPCLVIRGVCDYSDTHKNKVWQGYAAMAAAVYARDLLRRIHPNKIEAEKRLGDLVSDLRDTADEHKQISKQQLKVMQDADKRREAEEKTKQEAEKAKEEAEKRSECLHLFRLAESDKDATYESYKNRVENRVDGTCHWVLEHDNFCTWTKQDSGPLLISADPGCGKSVLAKFLVNSVLPQTSTICYFFFKEPDQTTVRQALCALLHQLFCQKPTLIEHAMGNFGKNGKSLINSRESLWEILADALNDPQVGPVIIVIDALDECVGPELNDLLCNIESQSRRTKAKSGKLKFLLTTRPYDQILSKFQSLFDSASSIRIPGEDESERISHEVNLVIKYRVDELAKEKAWKEHIKIALSKQLLAITHRTYLWVYLMFEFLRSETVKKTEKGVLSAIQALPKDVDAAYNKILSKSKDQTVVRKVLAIILAADGPLSLAEMNVAVNVGPATRELSDIDLESEENFLTTLRSWCGLFVSVYKGKIYFLHQTAREFLLADPSVSAAATADLCWKHSITACQAHRELAQLCMRYLVLFKDHLNYLEETYDDLDTRTTVQGFVSYAAQSWDYHFRKAQISKEDSYSIDLALQLSDSSSGICRIWFPYHPRVFDPLPRFATTLGLVSYLNLYTVVEWLLLNGADIEAGEQDHGYTPLQRAVYERNYKMTMLLLINRANANAKCEPYGSVLGIALRQVDNHFVELLLENGADMEAHVGKFGSALAAAAYGGQQAKVKFLLEKGADVDPPDGEYRSPLAVAACQGRDMIIKILLKQGANPSSKDVKGRTPLFLASQHGHLKAIEALLDYGAHPDHTDDDGRTPLCMASRNGHVEVVQLLLKHSANPDVRDEDGWSPLIFAFCGGRTQIDIVELLLSHGAVWPDTNNSEQTPSDLSLEKPDLGPIENLLKIDAGFRWGYRGWPLTHAAADRGYLKVFELLLDKGADITIVTTDGYSLLGIAASRGQFQVVKLLLDRGADIAAVNNDGRNPLHIAARHNDVDVTELLLKHGAEWSATDNDGWTPLHLAARYGSLELVILLVEKGAGMVNATTNHGETPLHLAAVQGYPDIVEFLLERYAGRLIVRTNNGDTPIHLAVLFGHLEVVQLLLAKRVDLVIPNGYRLTPLTLALDNRHYDVARALLEENPYSASGGLDPVCGTIANLLAFRGMTDLLRFNVENNPTSLHLVDDHNRTPLQVAARSGHVDTYLYVASRGLDPTSVDAKGDNLVCYAASSGSIAILRAVLEGYAQPLRQKKGWTPLHWACRKGSAQIVETLVAGGWNCENVIVPELQGNWTPFAVAVFHGNKRMIERLSESTRAALSTELVVNYLEGQRHGGYECDGCFFDIHGPRFNCLDCGNFDYCFMCKSLLEHLHEEHRWNRIEAPA